MAANVAMAVPQTPVKWLCLLIRCRLLEHEPWCGRVWHDGGHHAERHTHGRRSCRRVTGRESNEYRPVKALEHFANDIAGRDFAAGLVAARHLTEHDGRR